MRLLTTAAFDRGKGEDTFGMRDEDWLVYKKMSKENEEDDDGKDDDESELARIASKIQVRPHSQAFLFMMSIFSYLRFYGEVKNTKTNCIIVT